MHAHCQTCLPQTLIILSAQVYNKITRRNIKIDLRIYNRKLYCVKVYQHIWTSKSIFFLIHMLLTIFIHSLNYLNCHMEVKILMSDVSHLFIHHFVICVGSIINVQLEELQMFFFEQLLAMLHHPYTQSFNSTNCCCCCCCCQCQIKFRKEI